MNKIQETNLCGRAEQLVGYLYGESSDAERAGFEQHLAACGACREELSAFRQVRESVGAWRAEVLTHAPAITATELIHADVPTRAPRNATSPRTAWDALREFFALTPAWLRAASVAAALVVCALAALAVANAEVGRENGNLVFRTGVWRSTPNAPQTLTASAGGVNAAQLDQLVAERDAARRELDETRAQLDDSRAANIQAVYDVMDDSSQADAGTQAATTTQGASKQKRAGGANVSRKSARRGASEDDLPRLIDLLNSGN
jgi:hypothetical protein